MATRILSLIFVFTALTATAQEYKAFKVNLSIGYAKALGEGLSGGALVAIEPKYGLTDNFDVGLRLEAAFVARGVTVNGNTSTGEIGRFGSYLLTGTYLIGRGSIRPFIGLGVGIFNLSSGGFVTIVDNQTPEKITFVGETKFGGMLRAGVKAGHFVASVEYDAVPTTTNQLSTTTIDSKNAYLGIKVGFDIGGGPR